MTQSSDSSNKSYLQREISSQQNLSYLTTVDYLLVRQIFDTEQLVQTLVGITARVKFGIFNNLNQQICFAYEESNCFERFCCGSNRSFIIHIVNNSNQEIIRIERNRKFCTGICFCFANSCDCCTEEAFVESPPGTYIGKIRQKASCCRTRFNLINESNEKILSISSDYCICNGPCYCCCENKFTIIGYDDHTEIGAIHKKYAGFIHEAFTDVELFTITFPKDLDTRLKAIGLAALFLINIMHFTQQNR
ncbi:unnamed protein product [Adineta steineri]|uniref:Phospholipid scramblase n=1 Tax=Adineta steineri TaxID=433720 RepID=A0A815DPA3_9BILA|nr:unnamed protein product [Adineta steineri]CAF1224838.1 unnamed protein product [Adineta steineri]CAF1301036.1 unnamed protein product [Adineta steineri]CAF1301820.1 unnamed protein product [Adineta steineri]CAF1378154.1 unnamed protein product [Adineta steineri]